MDKGAVTYVVTPVGDAWKVGMAADSQPGSVYADREEAIAHAERLARTHERAQVVIRDRLGGIERTYSVELPRSTE